MLKDEIEIIQFKKRTKKINPRYHLKPVTLVINPIEDKP
jgi:hypothetical protein